MTKRLGRKTAGRSVLRMAGEFSDALLVMEESAFAAVDKAFRRPLPDLSDLVARRLRRAGGDVNQVRSDGALWAEVLSGHEEAVRESVGVAADLGRMAREMALASIREELAVCEATLPKKYAGVADAAVSVAETASGDVVVGQVERVTARSARTVGEFDANARLQVSLEDDADRLMLRLFSEEPARLRGFGGRGVWWWSASDVKAETREVAIRTSNWVREAAMLGFNEAHRVRA